MAANFTATRLLLVASLLVSSTNLLFAGGDEVSFSRDIAPIFAAKCYQCHGPDKETREAGLRLDRRNSATSELDSGSVPITPSDSTASELMRRIVSTGDNRMPPADTGEPLTESEVNTIAAWIDGGAEYQGHWAFEPFDFSPPTVDSVWAANEVDRFIVAKLTEAGLQPAGMADKHTLLRRVYFDVLGLPPSVEQIHNFVSDHRPDAFERLVERLLASPAYGERWGRHWLDVARYGDSNGGDENHAYPLAHRYRDYVIEAFNEDLTFDEFIKHQLAGDLLNTHDSSPGERLTTQRLTATGYLAIGMKILAEQDPVKKQADMVDEQIDTFGRTFLGLSLGCARCHDHKFDPIPTKDYYALAGIFHSSNVGDQPLKTKTHEADLATYNQQRKRLQTEFDQLESSFEEIGESAVAIIREAESFDRGNVVKDTDNYGKGIGIISDPGGQLNFAEYDVDIPDAGHFVLQLRYAAKTARPGKLSINGTVVKTLAINKATGGWMPESQRWFTEDTFELKQGTNTVRIESEPMMSHIDKLRLIRPEHLDTDSLDRIDQLTKSLADLDAAKPQPSMVMAVIDGQAKNTKVHERGSHLQLGEEVPRSFLDVLDGETASIPNDQSGRLHLAKWLTDNKTAATLTSRVITNRVWHWHFGRGLVNTPDDFGIRGDSPTHPKLLDFLANELIRNDWSIKALHRLILNSKTYRMQSTSENAAASKTDPGNALYWRRNRIRLDAESIRDGLMLQSGKLTQELSNATMYVKSQDPSPHDMATNLEKYESSPRRSVYLPVVRSNVYEFFTLFDFPNASTPVGKRNETTIPTQALWMMNSPFLTKRAAAIAERVIAEHDVKRNANAAIKELYLSLFCRTVSETELTRGARFLRQYSGGSDTKTAWTAYCQVLLSSNDYLYLK